jgi:hypothetical protein
MIVQIGICLIQQGKSDTREKDVTERWICGSHARASVLWTGPGRCCTRAAHATEDVSFITVRTLLAVRPVGLW